MTQHPIAPVYPWVGVGEEVKVLSTTADIDGLDQRAVTMCMPLQRSTDLVFRFNEGPSIWDISATTMEIDHPTHSRSTVNIALLSAEGYGRVEPTVLAGSERLSRVIVHWVNLPEIGPAGRLVDADRRWERRWEVQAGPWNLTIDGRPDLDDVMRGMHRHDAQYAITHVGELRRVDGRPFDAETAANVLYGWQIAMSFALGRWVAPALPVGFSDTGSVVWEEWKPWRCDDMFGVASWWTPKNGTGLGQFVTKFLAAYLDGESQLVTKYLASYVIAANHRGTTTEARMMLAQAAIEYLAWIDIRVTGDLSTTEFKKRPAALNLRELLEKAEVPTGLHPDLPALIRLREDPDIDTNDGPSIVTRVRNGLTHPKDPTAMYRDDLLWQALQLTMEYAELLILHRLGYQGSFSRRYPPGRWSGLSEQVPWKANDSERP